jgi:predicted dehydrogenase
MASPLRMGILGAARIVRHSMIKPAREIDEVEIAAIAARDASRCQAFARKHGIPHACRGYQQLLDDPTIEAVYIPLPNSLHREWSIRALEAGKHVLCEKPLAANADEVQQMAEAATRAGKLLVEAFHYRYHPLATRIRQILDGGQLGPIRHIEAWACVPILARHDIRWQYELAGGAMMDLGVYAVNIVRFAAGAEPEVVSAEAKLYKPQVDRWLRAELRFPDGRTGRITCSMWSRDLLRGELMVRGERGSLKVGNPYAPHLFHDVRLKIDGRKTRERMRGLKSTYYYQLRAFAAALRGGPPMPTDVRDALANMRVVDAAYRAAGLSERGKQPATLLR